MDRLTKRINEADTGRTSNIQKAISKLAYYEAIEGSRIGAGLHQSATAGAEQ